MAKLQDSPSNCGALALVNALDALGEKLSVRAAETLAGTSAVTGTQEGGLKKALKQLEKFPFVIQTKNELKAWTLLVGNLLQGHPVLLLVDDQEHWVVATGLLGERILVVDSADGAVVKSYDATQLFTRWVGDQTYYGIAVVPGS